MIAGWEYAVASISALGMAVILTPIMRLLAIRTAIVDAPDGDRKLQTQAVPYLGGVAIAGSTGSTLTVAAIAHGSPSQDLPLLIGVLIPALLLAGVGLLDDVRGLTPFPRFLVQSAAGGFTAAVLVVTGTGAQISNIAALNIVLTMFWVIGVTNALNLLDNTDGVASGTAALASTSLGVIALLNGQYLVAGMSLVLAGSCLGFLAWNRFPASIYMGDSGSLFIGFMLAAVAIRIDLETLPKPVALSVPVIVILVPIFDTTLVVTSRLRRGLSPFVGGLDHAAHRLRRLGLTVPRSALMLWAASAVAGTVAIAVSQAALTVSITLIALCSVAFVLALVYALRLPDSGALT